MSQKMIFASCPPSSMAVPYHMYVLATAGTEIEKARPMQYGTGLLLVVLVFAMNLIAILIRDKMQKKRLA